MLAKNSGSPWPYKIGYTEKKVIYNGQNLISTFRLPGYFNGQE